MVRIIVACTIDGGIGLDGKLPWNYIKDDMAIFKNITFGNTIVMGRKTWDSLPQKPLKDRRNIVISSSNIKNNDVIQLSSIEDAVAKYPNALFIGGSSIYNYLITNNLVTEAYISIIKNKYDCDTFIDINTLRNKKNNRIKEHKEYDDFTYMHILFT